MSFIDNDPPKHLDIGSLTHPERTSIYGTKGSLLKGVEKDAYIFLLKK